MTEYKLELTLTLALIIIGLSWLFYAQFVALWAVLLLLIQGLSGLLIGASFIIMGWFGGDRVLALLLRVQALKQAQAEVKLMEARALMTQAEALAKLQTVTVAKPGHEVVISQIQHPLLPAQTQIAHHYVPQLSATAATASKTPPPTQDLDSIRRGHDWIRQTLFDEAGQLKVFHVKVDGPTGVGKTHLMLHLIWLLQQPHPAAEYWLSDPKFEGEASGWPFTPFITDFDQVAAGAEYLYEHVVTARKLARREGHPPAHPAFLIFDEADGCFDEHGEKFTKPVRRIIKEGRSGWTHCFVVGQSPLAKDAGFSGALFRNTARFIMGNEALAFTRNIQFGFWAKEHRDQLAQQLLHLQSLGRRYALVVPPSGQGLPFVGEIPVLERPHFVNLIKTETPAAAPEPSPATLPPTEEGYSAQFMADWQHVARHLHLVKYRGHKPTLNSLMAILDLTGSGRGDQERVRAIAAHLETYGTCTPP